MGPSLPFRKGSHSRNYLLYTDFSYSIPRCRKILLSQPRNQSPTTPRRWKSYSMSFQQLKELNGTLGTRKRKNHNLWLQKKMSCSAVSRISRRKDISLQVCPRRLNQWANHQLSLITNQGTNLWVSVVLRAESPLQIKSTSI